MPIHVFRCVNDCGHEVEKLTRTASAPVPPQVLDRCPNCGGTTRHLKAVSAPAVKTEKTTKVAQQQDYRRKNPDWKENVLRGMTADGRKGTDLKAKSAEAWGSAFSQQHGASMDDARKR